MRHRIYLQRPTLLLSPVEPESAGSLTALVGAFDSPFISPGCTTSPVTSSSITSLRLPTGVQTMHNPSPPISTLPGLPHRKATRRCQPNSKVPRFYCDRPNR